MLRYSLPAFVELVTLKVKTRPSWNFSISFPDIATSFPWHYGPPPTRGAQSRYAAFGSFARHTICLRRLFWYRHPLWDQLLPARVEFTILIPFWLSFLLSFVILRVCVAFSCGGEACALFGGEILPRDQRKDVVVVAPAELDGSARALRESLV